MDLAGLHAVAQGGIDRLVALDHALARELGGDDHRLEMGPVLALDPHLRPREPGLDDASSDESERPAWTPERATPTERLARLRLLRGVNPLFGLFVGGHLGLADTTERLLAWEAILAMPVTVARFVRVPKADELPPGPLAPGGLDPLLLGRGLATPAELGHAEEDGEEDDTPYDWRDPDARPRYLTLADKLLRLFRADFPEVDVRIVPVWAAGELLEFGGDFNKFIVAHRLQKQEGVIFRHLLRLILLIAEFRELPPPDVDEAAWREDVRLLIDRISASCRAVDAETTEKALEEAERHGDE